MTPAVARAAAGDWRDDLPEHIRIEIDRLVVDAVAQASECNGCGKSPAVLCRFCVHTIRSEHEQAVKERDRFRDDFNLVQSALAEWQERSGKQAEAIAERDRNIAAITEKVNRYDRECGEQAEEIARLKHATRTRPDYDFRCEDCGAPHNLDTSIPSEIWNAIARAPGAAAIGMPAVGALCTLCIDERMVKAGLTAEAEFYFVGRALTSTLYQESHGEIQAAVAAERERIINEIGLPHNVAEHLRAPGRQP